MFPLNISQLAKLLHCPDPGTVCRDAITGVTIDSRTATPGSVFFAMPGSTCHGFDFAAAAVSQGAVCIVSDDRATAAPPAEQPAVSPATDLRLSVPVLQVPDARRALQRLAMWNRQQSSALVAGITGTVGKTTTRQLLHRVLSSAFQGIQSPKNFNNDLGVPLSLLQLLPEHDFAVLEMGASHSGDIRFLTELGQPEFGILTCVTPVHLESFRTVDQILKTKQELAEAIPEHGVVFLNADDPLIASMKSAARSRCVLFGTHAAADIRAESVRFECGRTRFRSCGTDFQIHGGRHLLTSALAALAVARTVGIPDVVTADLIAEFQPDAGRGRIVLRAPWMVIDDSYNASPGSVSAVISTLSEWQGFRHRYLVLGDMLELGSDAVAFHRQAGRQLAAAGLTHTVVIGRYADAVSQGAVAAGLSANCISAFRDFSTALAMLDCLLADNSLVWIKGSRGMQLERVAEHLIQSADSTRSRRAA